MNRKERRRQAKADRGGSARRAAAARVAALEAEVQTRLAADQPAEALAACEAILALQPDRPYVLSAAGNCALQAGLLTEAERYYRAAARQLPGNADFVFQQALVLRRLGRLEEAAACYRRAAELRPDAPAGHHNLGNVLQQLGHFAAAADAYRRTLAIAPDAADTWRNLGIVLQKAGDTLEALHAYRRAVTIRPDWPLAYSNLGSLLLESGDARGAVDVCDDWLRRNPGNITAFALKAAALNELGEQEAARELMDFERFVRSERLAPPSGYKSLEAFNAALARHVLAHPTLRRPDESEPTYHHPRLHITGELLAEPKGPMGELESMILGMIEQYRRTVPADPVHPFLENWPERWHLTSWGVTIEGEGNLVPHIHLDGYLGGVYYVELPEIVGRDDAGQAGWFELGRPPDGLACRAEPQVRTIRPETGRIILFPSYFYHATIPFASGERRISIAFDVVPEK